MEDEIPIGNHPFSGAMFVSGRVGISIVVAMFVFFRKKVATLVASTLDRPLHQETATRIRLLLKM